MLIGHFYFEDSKKNGELNKGDRSMKNLVFILVTILALSSCKTTEVVTVEKVKSDTTYITKVQRDSIWQHDSVYVKEKGDSVLIERWHTKYIEKEVHDTTYVAKHDSVPVPYHVTKYVEKQLSWWQKTLMYAGGIFGLFIIVILYMKLRRWLF